MLDMQQWAPQPDEASHSADGVVSPDETPMREVIAPLLARPAVWVDPPAELRDEVVDSVVSELY